LLEKFLLKCGITSSANIFNVFKLSISLKTVIKSTKSLSVFFSFVISLAKASVMIDEINILLAKELLIVKTPSEFLLKNFFI